MALRDYILGIGDEVSDVQRSARKRVNYVRLKDGESIRGFLLTTDFVYYVVHNDYGAKIRSHACLDPRHGKNCLSCQQGVKKSRKAIVPIYDVETKEVRVFEASMGAMKSIKKFKAEYEDEATTTPISLARSGSSTDTTYTIMPVRVKPAERELFVKPTDIVLDDDFYMAVINPPSEDQIREILGLNDEQITPLNENDGLDDVVPF